MLNDSCRRFRDGFEPHSEVIDLHRRRCSDCDLWARTLEEALERPSQSALPTGLASRLRSIPENTVLCRDVDRLYRASRRRAAGDSDPATLDRAALDHLASCSRCRKLYGVLESALLETPLPLPDTLEPRLVAVQRANPWVPPGWIRDVRYAAAACLLLAATLSFAVGDASAAFQRARSTLNEHTVNLVEVGEERRETTWKRITQDMAELSEEAYVQGRQGLHRFNASWRELTHLALRELEAAGHRFSRQLRFGDQGDE